jgi:15-cis-phytoene synthase
MGLRSLYALCRISDDIVDSSDVDRPSRFSAWRTAVLSNGFCQSDPVLVAWAATCDRFSIRTGYVAQMLDTLGLDLATTRFQCFQQLAEYCYGVASTVGLLAMSIIGHSGPEADPYAVRLGVALQLTNVLRDIREDWERGRLYLPLDELVRFGLSESDIAAGRIDRRWREFMRFQINYNRKLYLESTPGIGLLNRDGRLAVAAAAAFYQAILDDIENHDYDVFSRRAHVEDRDKLRLLPLVWWQSARGGHSFHR